MTIALLKREIHRFLRTEAPEVICITGRWGVGKTFAWKRFLGDSQRSGQIALQKYAYVSLFGVESLDELKASVVESTIDSSILDGKPDLSSFNSVAHKLFDGIKQAGSSLTKMAKQLPIKSDYVLSANRILFALTSNQIVCFDDLERAGSKLDATSVMGLASLLKEEKGCKVVILLNTNALEGERNDKFRINLEKVADSVLKFEPTAAEAADIAIDKSTKFHGLIRECVISLDVTNIRVIKRAEKFCREISDIAPEIDIKTLSQVVRIVTLIVFSKFQPEIAPPLSFIEDFNSMADLLRREKKTSNPKEEGFSAQLRSYGFSSLTSFDKIFVNAIVNGFIDAEIIQRDVVLSTQKYRESERKEAYFKIWKDLHSTFSINEEEFLDRLEAGTMEVIDIVSGSELSSAVEILKEFDRIDRASALIDRFMQVRNEPLSFWACDDVGNFQRISDPDVRRAFQNRFEELYHAPTLKEILIALTIRNGWNDEMIAVMFSASKTDYIELFKSSTREEFLSVVSGALLFKNTSSQDGRLAKITEKVVEALNDIGAENRLNARRVRALLQQS